MNGFVLKFRWLLIGVAYFWMPEERNALLANSAISAVRAEIRAHAEQA